MTTSDGRELLLADANESVKVLRGAAVFLILPSVTLSCGQSLEENVHSGNVLEAMSILGAHLGTIEEVDVTLLQYIDRLLAHLP